MKILKLSYIPHSDHLVSISSDLQFQVRLTQRCQCADHKDSYNETVPEPRKSDVLVDAAHGSSEGFAGLAVGVELTDHDICWMRHSSTQNTG